MNSASGQPNAHSLPGTPQALAPPIYVGEARLHANTEPVAGHLVEIDGEAYYRIAHHDRMRPFFMSVVSDSDHWLFISSNGALTAGRKNPDYALFPYYTDDKIHDAQDLTGSKTLILAQRRGKTFLWEPFSERYRGVYALQRNLYKSVYGNTLRFEEINRDLGLTFSYAWCTSERFGFVKRAGIRNHGDAPVRLNVLDGLQNMLPYGVDRTMQAERSTLVDAYKKNELYPATGLGLFTLSSILVDKPEPSEALKATTVWSAGLEPETYLLSALQLDHFREGQSLTTEIDVRAERGAYFVQARLDLAPEAAHRWHLVAEVNQGPDDVVALSALLSEEHALGDLVERDVQAGTERLKRLVASADGLQCTEDRMATTRHYANTLFNVMRGGVFDDQYIVEREDLVAFIRQYNRPVATRQRSWLDALPARVPLHTVLAAAADQEDRQLERLCYEYLPLIFSRRHGDPSRPWNAFSIDIRNEDGSKNRSYQGNWRDIFQNWEALGLAFPGFLESMICKFVNASTADGYNPYRITRDGIDWEEIDPTDPWSYIGYWGDHQIIYLLKLLELSRAHHPGRLEQFLTRSIFAYANVPYRIKPYPDLLRDPHNTIRFDEALNARIAERTAAVGADGKLLWGEDDTVYRVNLAEKLLVSVLAKLTNFIPGGGIWMNTQRPEWNDANNALVGYGVSMVTLYYLRRFLRFASDLFDTLKAETIALSDEVADLLTTLFEALTRHRPLLHDTLTDQARKTILDALGEAGSTYRMRIYTQGFSGHTRPVPRADVKDFFDLSLAYMDHTIRANQRADALYHAYTLMAVEDREAIALQPLYAMLEGQVAALSAGVLSGRASLDVLAALKASALYRADQNSYLLYPDRRLPRFMEKNTIPPDQIEQCGLLRKLTAAGDRHVVVRDTQGGYHFNGAFRNKESVQAALDRLSEQGYAEDVARDRDRVVNLFEALFDHRAYTGRSGTFFGYEGLGCIYWHMVSKLVLAIQETYYRAWRQEEDEAVLRALAAFYYEARAGIGLNKTPDAYGAFPTDPYSHTPGHAGAQQPGMTGQVKEDIIARWGELGVRVEAGQLRFQARLLREEEFLSRPAAFQYYDVDGHAHTIQLEQGMLAFTYCQVPVIYRLGDRPAITITYRDGAENVVDGLTLDPATSAKVFRRQGSIRAIRVDVRPAL